MEKQPIEGKEQLVEAVNTIFPETGLSKEVKKRLVYEKTDGTGIVYSLFPQKNSLDCDTWIMQPRIYTLNNLRQIREKTEHLEAYVAYATRLAREHGFELLEFPGYEDHDDHICFNNPSLITLTQAGIGSRKIETTAWLGEFFRMIAKGKLRLDEYWKVEE